MFLVNSSFFVATSYYEYIIKVGSVDIKHLRGFSKHGTEELTTERFQWTSRIRKLFTQRITMQRNHERYCQSYTRVVCHSPAYEYTLSSLYIKPYHRIPKTDLYQNRIMERVYFKLYHEIRKSGLHQIIKYTVIS